MVASRWRSILKKMFSLRPSRAAQARPGPVLGAIEALEDRSVPATNIAFTGFTADGLTTLTIDYEIATANARPSTSRSTVRSMRRSAPAT